MQTYSYVMVEYKNGKKACASISTGFKECVDLLRTIINSDNQTIENVYIETSNKVLMEG